MLSTWGMGLRNEYLNLRPSGSLERVSTPVMVPTTLGELRAALAAVRQSDGCLTLAGGMRSFGTQFLPHSSEPSARSHVLLLTRLPKQFSVSERESDGRIWVRASGWATFGDLLNAFPGYGPLCPPTSKQVTLAGALAAACHNVTGFFADSVRRFSLLGASGEEVDCGPNARGLSGELFRWVPGSYGALGIVTEVELVLRPFAADEFVEVQVLGRGGRQDLNSLLQRLDAVYEGGEFPTGHGLYVCDAGDSFVLFGDRTRAGVARPVSELPLLGGSPSRNIMLQSLSSRFPRLSQRVQPMGLRPGRRFWADPVQFLFFQESYDLSYEWLSSDRLGARALRALGVRAELPVAHQTWVVKPDKVRPFLQMYLEMVDERPMVAHHLELQDLIRLPRANTPLHPLSALPEGGYCFTPSASLNRGERVSQALGEFFRDFSRRAFHEFNATVLLLKQLHVDQQDLRAMHQDLWEPLWSLKAQVDPNWRFSSQFLRRLHETLL